MTWKEFKAQVEAKGVHDDDEINYIDVVSDGVTACLQGEVNGELEWQIT